jgi:hypothetical protein
MEYQMQKMIFTLTAIGLAAALSTAGSQKVEAASIVPASIAQTSTASGVLLADWDGREHRSHWGFWQHRHYGHDHGYGYRHEGYGREGYRYRRGYENRYGSHEAYRERHGY